MDLNELLIDAAIVSVDAQANLDDVLDGAGLIGIDLAVGTARFGGEEETLVATPYFIGTAAPGPGSWLWGWTNVSGYPAPAVSQAERTRAFGAEHGIDALTEAEIPLDGRPPVDVAVPLATAASYACGGIPVWALDAGGGTVATFLLDHERLRLPPATGPRVARVLAQALGTTPLEQPRRSILAYAHYRGLAVTDGDEAVRIETSDGEVTVTFDDHGRPTNIEGSFGASGDAAPA
jgi:hypothetical protein